MQREPRKERPNSARGVRESITWEVTFELWEYENMGRAHAKDQKDGTFGEW